MGKTILFLIRSLHVGGAERQVALLAQGLREREYSVSIALFYGGGPIERDIRRADIPIFFLAKRGRWDLVGFSWRLLRLLRREKPHIVHSYLVVPNCLLTILKPLLPSTTLVWGVRAAYMDLRRYDWLASLSFRLSCRLASLADRIVVNSRAGKLYHQARGYPADKMVVIANGVDTNCFFPDPEAGKGLRRQWGVDDRDKLIGLVARLDPMKDHPTFIKAAGLLHQERSDTRFVCVGRGEPAYVEQLCRLASELGVDGSFIWAGPRDDMNAVYNAFDVAVSSSYGEGFSNAVAEAMACGIPCVVTNVGDSAWIVGDTGAVVPPGDPIGLSQAIGRILRVGAKRDPAVIRKRILDNFSREKMIDDFETKVLAR